MAFDIKIKPLVLFDLEDKIKQYEYETDGDGKRFYQTFLDSLSDLQHDIYNEVPPVYESVKKYVSKDSRCSLFYTIAGNRLMVIGLF